MSFKPAKLQAENARLRDEIRGLQRALKDISKDTVISNSASSISPSVSQRDLKKKPKFLLDDSCQSSASRLFKQWTPSKKENSNPLVANFGAVPKLKAKLTTTRFTDINHLGVSPTFRDCESPFSELVSERSDRREQENEVESKYDSEEDIEFPSISRVVETNVGGISIGSSLRSDLHRIQDSNERRSGRHDEPIVKQTVKDTFSSFYDAEDTVEELYRNQSVVSIEAAEPHPQECVFSEMKASYLDGAKPPAGCSSSLMKTIEALREENRFLRTKIVTGRRKKSHTRSKSPSLRKKSPSFQPANSCTAPDTQQLHASRYKKTKTPSKPRGRGLSRPHSSRLIASTSRQVTSRPYTSRSTERNKSSVQRGTRHCDKCDRLLSKGFSTAYCRKHGCKPQNDRSSSINLLTQGSFDVAQV